MLELNPEEDKKNQINMTAIKRNLVFIFFKNLNTTKTPKKQE